MNGNTWIGMGRLVRPPEFFPPGLTGDVHATFVLAVNRVVPSRSGPETDYVPCTVWGPLAQELCAQRTTGDEVHVIGRIRTDLIPQADGSREFRVEVRAEQLQLGRRSRKNLQPSPHVDGVTQAVGRLTEEFGG